MVISAVEDNNCLEEQITELLDVLAILISENPMGFSEHQLLNLLQKPPHNFFAPDALRDPLVLFQTHFLLFHCLYQLRGQWYQQGRGLLEISALSIKLELRTNCQQQQENTLEQSDMPQLLVADPLAQYYLDWSHFTSTKSQDVEALLTSFWQKVFVPTGSESIQQALILMELESPIPTRELKVQYRRLAQRHHPDKGGDSDRFKKICQAFHQLKQHNLLA